ncbi:isoprenylcysteine carboxylmethyltransferase family protein [Fulvivirga sp. M361]|uniref:methyltransferase family protein n=1 Tax=Fulvivirga sp. M361 TaxID=2594266 RepID=UPI00117A98B5|nr:isoprenylcysteine carboxylmethyltransferase family protein [Fulvivirga sp. M361]TRX50415.1 isoprenylcysteine carboxylmethyltransferase family protein [Fulvivirga sp. M361]
MQYVMLITAWGIYFFLHSALADKNNKQYARKRLGISFQKQRIIYTIISVMGLFLLFLFNGMIGGDNLLPDTREMKLLSLFIATGGILIGKAAFRSYSLRAFLGLEQEAEAGKFHASGILAHIRHPLYTATILLVIGFFLYDSRLPSLISAGCIFIYLPFGIYFEEKKLIEEFGEKYQKYKRKVPMLIPAFKKNNN